MGDESQERTANADEIKAMQEIVRDGMKAGALGLSVSRNKGHYDPQGRHIPALWADENEIFALADVLRDGKGNPVTGLVLPMIFTPLFAVMLATAAVVYAATGLGDVLVTRLRGAGMTVEFPALEKDARPIIRRAPLSQSRLG